MEPDIAAKIAMDFGEGSLAGVALALAPLDEAKTGPRIVRCVVFLANGDMSKLRHFVGQAVKDYRDVIYWAEYDPAGRTRDFNQPFPHAALPDRP